MAWWMENKLRMIQNNLRDIDARMDIDKYVETLKEFGANACMVGCGGITAFYPSQLAFAHVNPYLEDDFFGRLVAACHAENIRVIARFDFSKTHESVCEKHPEWYTRSIKGELVRYHDTVATCVNGGYQQEASLEFLEEALSRYPIDGVFFNMFGYQTRDYTGNYVGICQCDNCKARFLQETGFLLPTVEDGTDPVFVRYMQFKRDTVDQLLKKISAGVHSIAPDVVVCTYNHKGVDIVRNESNSAVDRPLPFWLYNSQFNVSVVENSYENKVSSNCVINAIDIPYRFMGVSSHLNQERLYGAMASGGGLDWCIIGDFEDYPDRENFAGVKEVFHFHKRHEERFSRLESVAKVLLVTEQAFGMHGGSSHEVLGIYRMLKEQHILFDVVVASQLNDVAPRLKQYDWVMLPGVKTLTEGAFLEGLRAGHVHVLATGLALSGQSSLLKNDFGIALGQALQPVRGAYLSVADKARFPSFAQKDWVYVDKEYRHMALTEGTEEFLPLVTPARYGPPERCFGHTLSQQPSAAQRGRFLYLPWMLGTLYYEQGYDVFSRILRDILNGAKAIEPMFVTNAPEQVEVFMNRCGDGEYLFQMLNLTGFNGMTHFAPVTVPDIHTAFPGLKVNKVERLTKHGSETVPYTQGFTLPRLGQYEAFLITTKENDAK